MGRAASSGDRDITIDVGHVHVGKPIGPKAADGTTGWECDDNCPHPDHDVNEPLQRAAERAATTIKRRGDDRA